MPQKVNKEPVEQVCFVIMPISEPESYLKGHFLHVYEDIIQPACTNAGFTPLRADEVKQSSLIHLDILQQLIDAPMAVCDLSSRNPNVLFELALRQAFDKPVTLIQEVGTPAIFDISPFRYTEYRKELIYREVLEDQVAITNTMIETYKAYGNGDGINSIVKLLALNQPARVPEIGHYEAQSDMQQLMLAEIGLVREEVRNLRREANSSLRSPYTTLSENIACYTREAVDKQKIENLLNKAIAQLQGPVELLDKSTLEMILVKCKLSLKALNLDDQQFCKDKIDFIETALKAMTNKSIKSSGIGDIYMSQFVQFISLPWVGNGLGVIGLVAAVYFYLRSKKVACLSFQNDEVDIIGGYGSAFPKEVTIRFADSPVDRVTAARFVIWNSGSVTLNGDQIVQSDPLRLELEGEATVLKARLVCVSRHVNAVWVKPRDSAASIVDIGFDYLDPNDGFTVEIIHSGGLSDLGLHGTLRGISTGIIDCGKAPWFFDRRWRRLLVPSWKIFFYVTLFIGLMMFVAPFWFPIEKVPNDFEGAKWVFAISGLFYIASASSMLWLSRRRYPSCLEPNFRKK